MTIATANMAARIHRLVLVFLLTGVFPGDAEEIGSGMPPNDVAPVIDTPDTEIWYAIYVAGERVGHSVIRRQAEPAVDAAEPCVQWTQTTHMTTLRHGMTLEQTVETHSRERVAGQVVSCGWSLSGAGSDMSWQGRVAEDAFVVSNGVESYRIDWEPNQRGFFGLEQSLLERPLRAGETRHVCYFMPILNQLVRAELKATGPDRLTWGDATMPAMHVRCVTAVGENRVASEMWLDEHGKILKQVIPGLQQVYRQMARHEAVRPLEPLRLDVGISSKVPVIGTTTPLATAQRATYLLEWNADCVDMAPRGSITQQVRKLGPGRVWLTLRRATPPTVASPTRGPVPAGANAAASPKAAVVRASANSADDIICKLAHEVAADEADAWRLAQALELFTYHYITTKDHSQGRASAEDVARTRTGDCTEHAVLLMALCRARGLTVREVSGLVGEPGEQMLSCHMWVEVQLAGDWYPLDATRPGEVGVAHLSLTANEDDCTCLSMYALLGKNAQLRISLVSHD